MKDIIFYRCVARQTGEIFVFYCNCLQGAVCANPCPAGTFGDNCLEKCECYNSASCHHKTGLCECPPGYKGSLVRNERLSAKLSFSLTIHWPRQPTHLLRPFLFPPLPLLPCLFVKIIYVGYGHHFR